MRNCKLCRLNLACNAIPGFCFLVLYTTIVVIVGGLGFLFFSEDLLF